MFDIAPSARRSFAGYIARKSRRGRQRYKGETVAVSWRHVPSMLRALTEFLARRMPAGTPALLFAASGAVFPEILKFHLLHLLVHPGFFH